MREVMSFRMGSRWSNLDGIAVVYRVRKKRTNDMTIYANCFSHSLAFTTSANDFIGMGGGFSAKSMFMISLDRPGLETMAIAV